MRCPVCQGGFRTLTLASQPFDKCEACGSIWIDRRAILGLRGKKLHEHPLLHGEPKERDRFDMLVCPQCASKMRSYDYRGGAVTVDQCAACDHLFLDAGELARILREWDEGFELSDDAKNALILHHLERGAATEGPGWTVLLSIVIGVLWVGLRLFGLSQEMGITDTLTFLVALGIALIVAILYWRRLMARRKEDHVRHVRQAAAYALNGEDGSSKSKNRPSPRTAPKAFPNPGE